MVAYSHFKRGEARLSTMLDRAGRILAGRPADRRSVRQPIEALRRSGLPVPANSVSIAATRARTGATLLTWDAHFRSIPRVGTMVLDSDY
jgi:predicted nucleic acid-binding protein